MLNIVDKFLKTDPSVIYTPLDGTVIALENYPDPMFAEGILGPGLGIQPAGNIIYAPFMGEVTNISEKKNAIALKSFQGVEIVIHIGVDTAKMDGEGFQVLVNKGKKVACGDALITFDSEKIKEAGLHDITAVVVPNAVEFDGMTILANPGDPVKASSKLIKVNGIDD